jgi:hypothetical protein
VSTKTIPKAENVATPNRSMRHFTPRPTKPGMGRPAGGHASARSLGRGARR